MGSILVTGAAGFIGRHVVRGLRSDGHDVTEYDVPDNLCELGHVSGFDAVVNLAAIGGAGKASARPREVFKNNAVAAISLRGAIDAAYERDNDAHPRPRIVHVSSFSVYGAAKTPTTESEPIAPLEIYGASKASQELAWTGYAGPLTILRLSSVYGPNMDLDNPESTVIAKIAKAARYGTEFGVFESGEQSRDFVHVDDVVDAVRASLKQMSTISGHMVYNVCSGDAVSILMACEMLHAKYRLTGTSRPGDMRICQGNPSGMRQLLGRDPHPFTPRDILRQPPSQEVSYDRARLGKAR
jgi:nucleoside-diphosphate-sugar epimerase